MGKIIFNPSCISLCPYKGRKGGALFSQLENQNDAEWKRR